VDGPSLKKILPIALVLLIVAGIAAAVTRGPDDEVEARGEGVVLGQPGVAGETIPLEGEDDETGREFAPDGSSNVGGPSTGPIGQGAAPERTTDVPQPRPEEVTRAELQARIANRIGRQQSPAYIACNDAYIREVVEAEQFVVSDGERYKALVREAYARYRGCQAAAA
jgi:hypothetical protein